VLEDRGAARLNGVRGLRFAIPIDAATPANNLLILTARSRLLGNFSYAWGGAQGPCRRELNPTSLFNRDLKNRLRRFVPGSIRLFISNLGPLSCGSWPESCFNPHFSLRPLCRFVVERSAPETQSLRRCVQLELRPPRRCLSPYPCPAPRRTAQAMAGAFALACGLLIHCVRSGRDLSGRRARARSWGLLPGLVRTSPCWAGEEHSPAKPCLGRPEHVLRTFCTAHL